MDDRPFDWMLDLVAPFMGWGLAVVIFLTVLECAGVR